jgi:hypothetical protein
MKKIIFLLTILTLLVGCSTEVQVDSAVVEETEQEVMQKDAISETELLAHNSDGDCWVNYDGNVYDITEQLPNYKEIAKYCGTFDDITIALSQESLNILVQESNFVGVLE